MSLHDPKFKYRPSFDTDIRKTFKRIKKEQQKLVKPTEQVIEIRPANKRIYP